MKYNQDGRWEDYGRVETNVVSISWLSRGSALEGACHIIIIIDL